MTVPDLLRNVPKPASISSTTFPAGMRVMFIGPHPDDFDANGLTLRYLRDGGSELRVLVVSGGSGVEDSYCVTSTQEVKERIREREQRASCRFFGLPGEALTFLHIDKDGEAQPVDSPANLRLLTEHVLSFKPDVIMLPHGNDTNQGHRVMHRMVTKAALRAKSPIALLLSRDPKTISMRTDLYTAFGEAEATWKATLLRFHDSQHQRNLCSRGHGFDERILAENRRAALELGLDAPYAEAFELAVPSASDPA